MSSANLNAARGLVVSWSRDEQTIWQHRCLVRVATDGCPESTTAHPTVLPRWFSTFRALRLVNHFRFQHMTLVAPAMPGVTPDYAGTRRARSSSSGAKIRRRFATSEPQSNSKSELASCHFLQSQKRQRASSTVILLIYTTYNAVAADTKVSSWLIANRCNLWRLFQYRLYWSHCQFVFQSEGKKHLLPFSILARCQVSCW